jgi:type II secretion system protein C
VHRAVPTALSRIKHRAAELHSAHSGPLISAATVVALLLVMAIIADALSFYRGHAPPARISVTHVPVVRAAPPLVSTIVDAHLFGRAPASPTSASNDGPALKLTGTIVWEGDASRGYAILGPSEQKTQTFSPGMSLDGGARLDRVFKDHVRLAVNGGYTNVALPRHPLHGLLATAAPASGAMAAERTWLGELEAQPAFDDGHFQGFVVNPSKDIRQRFGLQDGDVVTKINGVALDRPTSAESVLQKLPDNTVIMTIIRDGSFMLVTMDLGLGGS